MKCEKTISGKHLFMPIEGIQLEIWVAHGIEHPQKCVACGLIDDVNHSNESLYPRTKEVENLCVE